MTGIRQSMVWALEDEFGAGNATGVWRAPPPGTFFSSQGSVSTSKVTEEGNKFLATYAFGSWSGSFDWSFTLDYDYMDVMLLCFDSYACEPDGSWTDADGVSHALYSHVFEKVNGGRVPTFTVRRKILNRIAGGPDGSDEVDELRGCVVQSLTMSCQAGSSKVNVSMTGIYRDERMLLTELEETDWSEYDGDLVEFLCMFDGDPECSTYFRNIDSLGVSMTNSASFVYPTCSPFASAWAEGQTAVSFNASAYSDDPSEFKQRLYSSGYRNTDLFPQSKNRAPIPKLTLAAYSMSMRDDGRDTVQECIAASPETASIVLEDVVVKSLTWQKGDSTKMQDQLSSTDAKRMSLLVRNMRPDLKANVPHRVASLPATVSASEAEEAPA